ncbi:hypothetical protein OB955_03955 [Halobacteria archaeon AArc-m2/3/4]|uniref:Uncharacterized protein n=1 Tax=Natronoglomus mannanivorans TaxID=2979990 RepID=A0AAP2Z0S3_9EURY|nr:hypothetical protein [Halobacteria archaeon AArc-xg1-1]MCU4971892.1 hypothetical protein [Halobacteria archaeon AArc-m2/3/4]
MDLRDPPVRWGLGLASGAIIAAVAVFFLEGTIQLLVLGIAVFDAVSTPQVLRLVAEGQAS